MIKSCQYCNGQFSVLYVNNVEYYLCKNQNCKNIMLNKSESVDRYVHNIYIKQNMSSFLRLYLSLKTYIGKILQLTSSTTEKCYQAYYQFSKGRTAPMQYYKYIYNLTRFPGLVDTNLYKFKDFCDIMLKKSGMINHYIVDYEKKIGCEWCSKVVSKYEKKSVGVLCDVLPVSLPTFANNTMLLEAYCNNCKNDYNVKFKLSKYGSYFIAFYKRGFSNRVNFVECQFKMISVILELSNDNLEKYHLWIKLSEFDDEDLWICQTANPQALLKVYKGKPGDIISGNIRLIIYNSNILNSCSIHTSNCYSDQLFQSSCAQSTTSSSDSAYSSASSSEYNNKGVLQSLYSAKLKRPREKDTSYTTSFSTQDHNTSQIIDFKDFEKNHSLIDFLIAKKRKVINSDYMNQ